MKQLKRMTLTLLVFLLLVVLGQPVWAATIKVNTTEDILFVNDDVAPCSLRAAIISANQDISVDGCVAGNGDDEIVFVGEGTPQVYRLSIQGEDENSALNGDLDITSNLTITGRGASQTIIDGGNIDRVFHITFPREFQTTFVKIPVVRISGVTIQNGSLFSTSNVPFGGGVANNGQLIMENSTIINNSAPFGGGVANGGNLTIEKSTIKDNKANHEGGGIYTQSTEFILKTSTISNNVVDDSTGFGGGIANLGVATLVNSTVSGNRSSSGGGIWATNDDGETTLTNTTVANNSGGISGIVGLHNSIIANNLGGDCGAKITSLGGNLDSDGSCGLDQSLGDLPNTDPLLGPFLDNGGPTFTHALMPGSPAINVINPIFGVCTDHFNNTIATDQRGVKRPQGDDCDIGAYEAEDNQADLSIIITGSPNPVNARNILTYSIEIQNSGPHDATEVSVIDTLPPGVAYQATQSSPECVENIPGTIKCDLDTVVAESDDVSRPTTLQIVVIPSAGVSGTITNTATVSAIETDPNLDNNIDWEDTEVISLETNLSITKSIIEVNGENVNNPEAAVLGSLLVYTLSITNEGPQDANGIIITDEYQRFIGQLEEPLEGAVVLVDFVDLNILSSNCRQVETGSKFSCDLDTLPVGETVSITIGLIPIGAGALVNTAKVTANELDPEPENNVASISIRMTPPQQLNSASRFIDSVFDFPDNPELSFVLVGSPLNLLRSQPPSVLQRFGPAGRDDLWRLFHFNPGFGRYDVFSPGDTEFDFLPGRGFWLVVRNANLLALSGIPNDVNVPFDLSLQSGLQQIATPFNFPDGFLIDWSNCVAELSGGVSHLLFDYKGSEGGYVFSEFMEPMHAYWVAAESAMTLSIPPDCVTIVDTEDVEATRIKARVAIRKPSSASVGWRVKLSANAGAMTDLDNFIGMDSAGADGYDALDTPEPPPLHQLSLTFPHPEWDKPWTNYASDIRRIKSGATKWKFTVNTGLHNTQITLKWRLFGICSKALLLHDVDAKQSVDMNDEESYSFYKSYENTRHFEITANWFSCL